MKKRLLCILSSLNTGGAETFMMKVFRALPKDYKIDFVVSSESGFYEKEVIDLGGKIFRIPLRTKHPLKTIISIYKIVKGNNYSSVLKLCDTPIGVFDLIPAKLAGAKKICVRSCNANSNESGIRKTVNKLIRPLFNRITNVKIAPSILAAEYTFGKRTVSKGKVVFLHNAVDLNYYKYDEVERKRLRKQLGIADDITVIGHIGRFNYQKNHDFIIRLFDAYQKKHSNTKLLLVGEGELVEIIKRQVDALSLNNCVSFLGVRSDVPAMLSAFDVLLLPSFYEGMPNVVIEAQAVGLPCVISDTITREANITGMVHYLSLNDDMQNWVEIINKLAGVRINNTTDDFVRSGYVIDSVVDDFIKLVYV